MHGLNNRKSLYNIHGKFITHTIHIVNVLYTCHYFKLKREDISSIIFNKKVRQTWLHPLFTFGVCFSSKHTLQIFKTFLQKCEEFCLVIHLLCNIATSSNIFTSLGVKTKLMTLFQQCDET